MTGRLRGLGTSAAALGAVAVLLVLLPASAVADPQANLQVSGLRGTPSADQTKLRVSFTVTNVGTAPSGVFAWTAYLSPTTNVADAVSTLLANPAQPSLDANGGLFSRDVTVGLTTSPPAGTYYVLLRLPTGVSASAPFVLAPTPNLVLSGLTAPSSVSPAAGSATVGFTVANTGAGAAAASHVGVYLSSDATLGAGDALLTEVPIDALAAGANRSYQQQVPLPSSLAPAHYYLIAHANDVAGEVTETRTDDNTGAAALVSLAPDLVVHSISGPASVNGLGASATINFTIGNPGTQDVTASTHWALYLTQVEQIPTGVAPFSTGTVSPISGGDFSSSISAVVSLPLVPAGRWCVYVQADSSNQVAEWDETNNWGHTCITVLTALDLTPTSFAAPSSVSFTGGSLQASVTVANNGNAPSGDSVLGFYLSRTSSLDTSTATPVGTAQVASIPAFGSSVVNATLTVPPGTAGRYTLFAVADATNVVSEVNEANNTAAQTLDLVAPDLKPQVTQPAQDAHAGGTVSLAFTVADAGTDAAGATAWKLYLSDDGTLTGATDLGVGGAVPALAAGATSAAIQASATVPAGTLPGRHCLVVSIDPNGAVAESDETNNLASSCFTVVDSTPPVSSGSISPSAPGSGWYTGPVSVSVTATDLGGVKEIHYAIDGHETVVAGSSASFAVSADGTHAVSWFAVDTAGNAEQAHQATVRIDTAAPQVSCGSGSPGWHAADVTVPCTATDSGSGLAAPGDASFVLATSVPAGSEDASAPTGSRRVCDTAGNCADAGPFSFQVDRKAPSVSCTPPDSQAWHMTDVTFACTASDGGSGPAQAGFTLSTAVPDGTEDAAAPTGSHQACDAVGNCAPPTSLTAAVDKKAPTVSCPSAGTAWHRTDASFDCTVADGGSGPVASTVTLTAQAPADAETESGATGTAQACDLAGNCVTAGPVTGIRFDTKAPAIACSPPAQAGWYRGEVSVPCTAADGGSGVSAGDASFSLTAAVPAGTASAAAATGPREVCDAAGNCADAPFYEFGIDEQAPQVSCPQPDGAWHGGDVSYACTADDGAGSGLASAADAAFTLATNVPPGQEDAAAPAGSRTVCDLAGNCADPVSRTAKVDRKAPTVTCPTAGTEWHGADASFDCTVADGGSGPVAPTVTLTAQAPADAETTLSTGTAQACDAVGNCTIAGPIAGVRFDTKAPTFSCDQPDGAWHKGPVSLVCHGQDGGSGLAGPAALTLTASVADGVEDAAAFTNAGSFCDTAGNCAAVPALGPVKLDRKAPTVTCPAADSAWHAGNVGFTCVAADTGSGPASATVQLTTNVPAGSETANASTAAQQACDAVGNCAPAGPVGGVKVDRKAPAITIAAPTGSYTVGAHVNAGYSCVDGGSGAVSCSGPVANGAAIDTQALGAHTFVVGSRDAVGNTASATSTYTIAYGVCVPANVPPGPVGGKTVRVWLIVCDADGRDISSKKMDLTALGVDNGPLPELPGNRDFHYEPKFGFRYDLDGSKLPAGTHTLRFSIAGDPVVRTVQFRTPK